MFLGKSIEKPWIMWQSSLGSLGPWHTILHKTVWLSIWLSGWWKFLAKYSWNLATVSCTQSKCIARFRDFAWFSPRGNNCCIGVWLPSIPMTLTPRRQPGERTKTGSASLQRGVALHFQSCDALLPFYQGRTRRLLPEASIGAVFWRMPSENSQVPHLGGHLLILLCPALASF